jgi:hypothetical protein
VIESKNYSGWIFGSAEQKNWTQMLNRNSKKSFYNPVMQNNTHVSALSKFLSIDKNKFMSFIVFSDRCELKKIPENTENRMVIHRKNLIANIQNKRNVKNFTDIEINGIYEKLKPLTLVANEQKQAHIERIKKMYKPENQKVKIIIS